MEVKRSGVAQEAEARVLLSEYYAEIGVVQRDTPEAVHDLLERSDSALWIAYAGETPAGCVALRPLDGLPLSAECKRLYVRVEYRRQGIAEALMDALENFARAAGLRWIYLDSMEHLRAAIALYERRGYEHCERYNKNPQATVFLRKALTTADSGSGCPTQERGAPGVANAEADQHH